MAKGNPFMGTMNGRIGDNVLYVSKGEQNIIKYQKNVTNPQSNGQMYQRARFSNAGRFFTRGRKAFFKFAFENKKGSQSDFNAFMRANINRSVLISKSALQLEGYPAIGKFIMSQGSLAVVNCRIVNDYWQAHFGIEGSGVMPNSVGGLSKLLVDTGNYQQGDILTFVFLNTSGSGILPQVKPQGNFSTDWTIKQFRLNVADQTLLSNYEMRATSRSWDGKNYITLTDLADSQLLTSAYGGFVCVHSRNTAQGLRVSTQELSVGESMQDAIDMAMMDDYIYQVIEDWRETDQVQIAPTAMLKGSLSWEPAIAGELELIAVPNSNWTLDKGFFQMVGSLEDSSTYLVGYIRGKNIKSDDFFSKDLAERSASEMYFNDITEGEFAGCVSINIATDSLEAGRYSWAVLRMVNGYEAPVAAVLAQYEPQP